MCIHPRGAKWRCFHCPPSFPYLHKKACICGWVCISCTYPLHPTTSTAFASCVADLGVDSMTSSSSRHLCSQLDEWMLVGGRQSGALFIGPLLSSLSVAHPIILHSLIATTYIYGVAIYFSCTAPSFLLLLFVCVSCFVFVFWEEKKMCKIQAWQKAKRAAWAPSCRCVGKKTIRKMPQKMSRCFFTLPNHCILFLFRKAPRPFFLGNWYSLGSVAAVLSIK